jgi:hypothetical protein
MCLRPLASCRSKGERSCKLCNISLHQDHELGPASGNKAGADNGTGFSGVGGCYEDETSAPEPKPEVSGIQPAHEVGVMDAR